MSDIVLFIMVLVYFLVVYVELNVWIIKPDHKLTSTNYYRCI